MSTQSESFETMNSLISVSPAGGRIRAGVISECPEDPFQCLNPPSSPERIFVIKTADLSQETGDGSSVLFQTPLNARQKTVHLSLKMPSISIKMILPCNK